MVRVKEIFASIQGEGPFVGYKQLFIRFCGCNLNCSYCDTNFDIQNSVEYSVEDLTKICNKHLDCHSVSLTGGEPLLQIEFLEEFVERSPLPIYLETNGTLFNNLKYIIHKISYVSADIKLPSATGLEPKWNEHDKFFEIAAEKTLFVKVVFNEFITEEEIINICKLCSKYDVELILQPMMVANKMSVTSEFLQKIHNKCLKLHKKTRLIPQVHKFLNVE